MSPKLEILAGKAQSATGCDMALYLKIFPQCCQKCAFPVSISTFCDISYLMQMALPNQTCPTVDRQSHFLDVCWERWPHPCLET
jgi:hypothetical protein